MGGIMVSRQNIKDGFILMAVPNNANSKEQVKPLFFGYSEERADLGAIISRSVLISSSRAKFDKLVECVVRDSLVPPNHTPRAYSVKYYEVVSTIKGLNGRNKKVTNQVVYSYGKEKYGKPLIINKFYEGKVFYKGLDNYRSSLVDIGAILTSLVRLCDSGRNSRKYGVI